jgi:hypothetical protein
MAKKVKAAKPTTKEIATVPKAVAIKKGDFTIKNNLLTIRHWSHSYTTSLFDKNVINYTLVCQYPLSNFNLDILKDIGATQLYLDVADKVYIARVSQFVANVSPESVVIQLTLANLRLKSGYDLEFATPSVFYEQILADKIFFKAGGKKLEEYVKPLGISRKTVETDQALRRRTLEYLNYKMGEQGDNISEAELRRLRGEK